MGTEEAPPIKIVIVGGAAGGISAALRARRLDEKASITLIEKGHCSSYANSGVPSSVGGVIETDTHLIHQTPTGLKDRFNLDARDDTELASIFTKEHSILVKQQGTGDTYVLPYDKLILAQGAQPISPHVLGIDRENVFPFQTMLDLERIKNYIFQNRCRSAVVLGGGYLAMNAVESLYNFGLHISIVHDQERLCEDFDLDIAHFVQSELEKGGIELHLNANIRRIALGVVENGCFVTLDDCDVPADIVVVAMGLNPRIAIAKQAGLECKNGVVVNDFMQTSDPDVYAIGAMAETKNLVSHMSQMIPLGGPMSKQCRHAVDHIMKRAVPYRGHVGTYSCKVLHLTAAIAGLSLERLREIGYHPQSVTVHVPETAGYYPAIHQMTLRLAFQSDSGRLLSAQIVGRSGVDRRIDVLSTALQAGMSVFDLETLELSYAPQYGSAKDPVNMIGMIASNLLRGDLHIVTPRELAGHLNDWQIIDVRSPEDFGKGHIPSALNIPIDTLRESLAGIDKKRPVVVYSRVGYHGYLAYRTLKQLGYQVVNLDGGLKLLIEGGSGIGLVSTSSA